MVSVEQFSERLIDEACLQKATDIHIIPKEKQVVIQFRIDEEMISKYSISKQLGDRFISHLKFLASMDIGEQRRPQNGALSFTTKNNAVHLRLSTLPTVYHESLVIRILPNTTPKSFEQLSLFQQSTKKILSFINHAHGLIIFTGPTGSGKTTTLYSLLHYAKKNFNRNIITLEDPVETKSEEVLQVQVNERAGITYTTGLKAILRHDPDIIMVGEIRDAETAKIAVRAALTGHLVLSTMHTKDSVGAIYRLLEFGVPISEIEQTLIALIAQRLVPLSCPYCNGKCSPYCKALRTVRRLGVYELLYGRNLQKAIQQARGEEVSIQYKRLKDVIKKGIALGFLYPSTYERWVVEHEEK